MKRLLSILLPILLAVAACANANAQKFEGLAATPQMGWNSWNTFACNINEQLIRDTADAMIKLGLKDAGYEYVNIDDCWHGQRDQTGAIHPDAERFPSGMKALADYVHGKGLKLGIYESAGTATCATIGPWSRSGVTKCTVAPCSLTPAANACRCVASPGKDGNSDGWMLSIRPA